MKLLIVVPTYNEKDNIPKLLGRLLNVDPQIEILVVDDNSPDGTGELVEGFTRKESRLHLLSREKKAGIGPAYIAGFKWALERDYDYVMEMDADLSHRPRYIPQFMKWIKEYDLVVGSRWAKGGRIANWPASRIWLSRLANIYAKLVLGVDVFDMTGGYVCYRRCVLESIDLDRVKTDGYGFQIEMKYKTLHHGYKIKEFPIQFTDRQVGESKISRRIVWEALLLVVVLRMRGKKVIEQPKQTAAVG